MEVGDKVFKAAVRKLNTDNTQGEIIFRFRVGKVIHINAFTDEPILVRTFRPGHFLFGMRSGEDAVNMDVQFLHIIQGTTEDASGPDIVAADEEILAIALSWQQS